MGDGTPASQRRNQVSGKRWDLPRVTEHALGTGRIELRDSPPQGSSLGEKELGSGRKEPSVSGFPGGAAASGKKGGPGLGPLLPAQR